MTNNTIHQRMAIMTQQNPFSLEYQDEHDDFFYLCNFVKDPESYITKVLTCCRTNLLKLIRRMQKKNDASNSDSGLKESFYPHVNLVGIEDAHQVIISVRKTPDSNAAYIGVNRTRTVKFIVMFVLLLKGKTYHYS